LGGPLQSALYLLVRQREPLMDLRWTQRQLFCNGRTGAIPFLPTNDIGLLFRCKMFPGTGHGNLSNNSIMSTHSTEFLLPSGTLRSKTWKWLVWRDESATIFGPMIAILIARKSNDRPLASNEEIMI
jgi:hypothetical protein